MSAESDLEGRIAALDPNDFERLVFNLVRQVHPEAERLHPPDGGADTIVLSGSERRSRVCQAKRHRTKIVWSDCEDSLTAAIRQHDPESVTFVFARNLTAPQLATFQQRLRAPGAEVDVEVKPMGLSALRAWLQEPPRVQADHFGYDARTLLDIFATPRSDADPMARALGPVAESLPPRPSGPPPDDLTKHLRPGEELFVWSDGYLWMASGRVAVTSDRILFVHLGGIPDDHPIAVDRRVSVGEQVLDLEFGGGLWRFRGLNPDIAKEAAASIVPGFVETLFEGDPEMQAVLRARHDTIAARAVELST